MKPHHKVHEIRQHLCHQSVLAENTTLSYDRDINTQGIQQFIHFDRDIIRYFVTDCCNWLDQQKTILEYFEKTVGDFDRDAVIKSLNKYGILDGEDKKVRVYGLAMVVLSFVVAVAFTLAFSLGFFASVMIFITAYTITLILATIVMEYLNG